MTKQTEEKYLTLKIYILPILLFLLNLGLRIFNIRINGLSGIEAFDLFYSDMPVSKLMSATSSLNNPPLYIFFMKFWTLLNGIQEGWIRLPSVIFASLTSVLIYQIGRKYITFQVGLFSALAFSACTMGYLISEEASVYSLLTFLATFSMYLYLGILKSPGSKPTFYFLLIVNFLLVYSHFYGITILITQLFFLTIITRNQDKVLVAVLRNNLILLLLFIPGIWMMAKRIFFIKSHGSWLFKPTFDFFIDGFTNICNKSLIAIIFLAILVLAYLLFAFKDRSEDSVIRTAWKLIPLWFFIPYMSIFLFSFWLPIFQARNMIFISPAFYLTTGLALSYTFKKMNVIQYCFMASLIIVMVVTIDINPTKKNHIREVTRVIKKVKNPETAVVINPFADYLAFTYYNNRNYFRMSNHTEELNSNEHIYYTYNQDSINSIAKTKGNKELIYYQTGLKWEERNEKINKILTSNYAHIEQLYYLKPFAVYRFYN